MNFGEVLQTKRKAKGFTQEELANKLLVSSKTISNWETNKTTPDIDNVIRLSRLFDISLDNLLFEGSDMVENIKKNADIKQSKIYLACSSITNLIFMAIIAVSPVFGEIPHIIAFLLAIGTVSNCLCVFYFSKRYVELTGNTWDKYTKTRKIGTVIACVIFAIAVLGVIWFIRFKYNTL